MPIPLSTCLEKILAMLPLSFVRWWVIWFYSLFLTINANAFMLAYYFSAAITKYYTLDKLGIYFLQF
jgi:hypothetical protein